jgi:hypothetical protein
MWYRTIRSLLLLVLSLSLGACVAAALAGAGAATGIYLTTRGAKGLVEGTVADVERRAGVVLAEQRIEITERKAAINGSRVELKGETGTGNAVTVEIERKTASTTEVEVAVRESAVVWDQDRARAILERIVATR